jgi:hypothetical protein
VTEAQYLALTDRLRSLYPSIRSWHASLEELNKEGIKERWRLCLLPAEFELCQEALTQLARQAEDPWPEYRDKERAASIIADRARTIKHAAARDKWAREAPVRLKHGEAFPAGRLLKIILARARIDDRHSDECRAGRAAHEDDSRCRGECPVAKLVGGEVLREWEASDRCGIDFFAANQHD